MMPDVFLMNIEDDQWEAFIRNKNLFDTSLADTNRHALVMGTWIGTRFSVTQSATRRVDNLWLLPHPDPIPQHSEVSTS